MLFLSKIDFFSTCRRLDDEFNFLLERSLIPRHYRIRSSMFKLIDRLSSNSKTVQRNLSLYVFKTGKNIFYMILLFLICTFL